MSLKGNNREEQIWNYLIAVIKNPFGVAGLMGNLYAESALNPQNLQNTYEKKLGFTDASYTKAVDSGKYPNFIHDSAGYGLAQWTHWSRKENLLAFVQRAKKSIGDLETQLAFLMDELTNGYPSVLHILRNGKTVRETSDAVLLKFERPANQGESVQKRRAEYGQKYYDKYADKTSVSPNTTMKEDDSRMKSKEFIKKAIDIAQNYRTLYVMGCFGAPMTSANKTRYCTNHDYNKDPARQKMIKAASDNTFGFDCVCLIKGILWGWSGDKSKTYGGATYKSNGVPDTNANGMINLCQNVSTTGWNSMTPGEAVWCPGHIGIYIGDGLAVECTPRWENDVQITAVSNIGSKTGYNARKWEKHGKLPYVDYSDQTGSSTTPNFTPSKPAAQSSTPAVATKKVVATKAAHYKDTSLSGQYTTTADLHCRNGSSTSDKSLVVIPKGTKVMCYGYYNIDTRGVKWLYIQFTLNGVQYTGFSSSAYLKK